MSADVIPFPGRGSEQDRLLELLDRLAERVRNGEIEGIAVAVTFPGGGGSTEWVSLDNRMPDLIAVSVLLQARITMAALGMGVRQ